MLKAFGDSGIDLALYVWIPDPEGGKGNLQSTSIGAVEELQRKRNSDSLSAARDPYPATRLQREPGRAEPAPVLRALRADTLKRLVRSGWLISA